MVGALVGEARVGLEAEGRLGEAPVGEVGGRRGAHAGGLQHEALAQAGLAHPEGLERRTSAARPRARRPRPGRAAARAASRPVSSARSSAGAADQALDRAHQGVAVEESGVRRARRAPRPSRPVGDGLALPCAGTLDRVDQLAHRRDHRLEQVDGGRVAGAKRSVRDAHADRDRGRPAQAPALAAHHLQAAAAEVDRQQRVGRAGGDHARGTRARPPRRPISTRGITPDARLEPVEQLRRRCPRSARARCRPPPPGAAPEARAPRSAIWRTVSSTRSRPSVADRVPPGLQARRRGRSWRCRSPAARCGRRSARATSSRVVFVPTSIAAIGRGGDAVSSWASLLTRAESTVAPLLPARTARCGVTARRCGRARAGGAGRRRGPAAGRGRRPRRPPAASRSWPATTPRRPGRRRAAASRKPATSPSA